MPEKIDPYSTPSQKALGLYNLLLFSGRGFSLPELSAKLNCSKQTVLRLAEQIQQGRQARLKSFVKDGKRWFRIEAPRSRPHCSVSAEQIQRLVMCRDMVWHLLPQGIREEIEQTLNYSTTLLPDMEHRDVALTQVVKAGFRGVIDYTPHQQTIETILTAIRGKRVLCCQYQSASRDRPKEYCLAPYRLLSYHEALYVLGWLVTDKGAPTALEHRTFCIHRIAEATPTQRTFEGMEMPTEPEYFGFHWEEPFRVKVKFEPEVAAYVTERRWSEDQVMKRQKNGKLVLEFTAQSTPEVVSWVLSFGGAATVFSPASLKARMQEAVQKLATRYGVCPS